jgi:hypothetical protein
MRPYGGVECCGEERCAKRVLVNRLGECDDDPLGSADVGEPVSALVLYFADELGSLCDIELAPSHC